MKILPVVLLLVSPVSQVSAFPPAPGYTLYGIVRDQSGQVVRADKASVVLLKGTTEAGRATIGPLTDGDKNYQLTMRIDQARPSTSLYDPRAVTAEGQFSLMVELGTQRYYPIEVKGSLTAGKGGEAVRLDLTLGEDLDNDGLPDIWEQWQLYQAGKRPGADGKWPLHLLDKDGDFDGDGQSNYMEYLAGTFAGDASERFELKIKSKTTGDARFEFFAVTGKTYTLERSTDLKTWTTVPFTAGGQVPAPGTALPAGAGLYTATASGITTAACVPGADSEKELYRLTVR